MPWRVAAGEGGRRACSAPVLRRASRRAHQVMTCCISDTHTPLQHVHLCMQACVHLRLLSLSLFSLSLSPSPFLSLPPSPTHTVFLLERIERECPPAPLSLIAQRSCSPYLSPSPLHFLHFIARTHNSIRKFVSTFVIYHCALVLASQTRCRSRRPRCRFRSFLLYLSLSLSLSHSLSLLVSFFSNPLFPLITLKNNEFGAYSNITTWVLID
jgi:hypothetical protein